MTGSEAVTVALARVARPWHVPASTYRLQFHAGFGFRDAAAVVPYLHRLGATTCYSSPCLMAKPGSLHGYDICDHTRLNPDLGTAADYEAFAGALRAHGMGQTLDFVPNHMGIDPETNPWWHDVLENGPSSVFARFFDIDWFPVKEELRVKVLLPILGDQYGLVLERGELRLGFERGGLVLQYFDQRLPVNPRQATKVYRHGLESLRERLGDEDPHLREFLSIVTALTNLPAYQETDPERIAERRREKGVARERLARLAGESAAIREHIEAAILDFNGEPGRAETFDLLHDLLEAQAYRLSYWRTAAHEINYRRFFDVNTLAAIRMEQPEVFDLTHALIADLIRAGHVTGLRIDHPDGLFDPQAYFGRLQDLAAASRPDGVDESHGLYVVAEKVLSRGEDLAPLWPVCGTTGYNFLNAVNGLFVDSARGHDFARIYRRVSGLPDAFDQMVYDSKKLITESALASEMNVLAHALNRISENSRRSRDFTLNSLTRALQEVVACFPVYRTYVGPGGWSADDRRVIAAAVDRAQRRNPAMESSIFAFVLEVLLPRLPAEAQPPADGQVNPRRAYPAPNREHYEERLAFSMRFQQYTAPVQAKGVEDTAFYRYNLLVSLNEVGGDPARFGRSAEEFHAMNRRRLERWPYEALATATHDTKLGEDTRTRIDALSEVPEEWGRAVSRWMRINAGNRLQANGVIAPDRNDEYRFYQVLVGLLPPGPDEASDPAPGGDSTVSPDIIARLREYMIKAAHEAKVHTSWINPNETYDQGLATFVERTLAGTTARRFLATLAPLHRRIARLGALNSLAQLALKLTVPGVPDCYQGTELWDLSLVDPDNRRPVDYGSRALMLSEMEAVIAGADVDGRRRDADTQERDVAGMVASWWDARIKLFLMSAGLRLRRARPNLFLHGDYVPLSPEMDVAADTVAFARVHGPDALVVVVPRLAARIAATALPLGQAWGASNLPLPAPLAGRACRNLLTGHALALGAGAGGSWLDLSDVFRTCPIGLLWAE